MRSITYRLGSPSPLFISVYLLHISVYLLRNILLFYWRRRCGPSPRISFCPVSTADFVFVLWNRYLSASLTQRLYGSLIVTITAIILWLLSVSLIATVLGSFLINHLINRSLYHHHWPSPYQHVYCSTIGPRSGKGALCTVYLLASSIASVSFC